MPIFKNSQSIAAGATVENVLTGSQFEFLPMTARLWHLEFALVGAAAGLIADVFSGQDTLTEQMDVSSANRSPVYPDDFDLEDVAGAGERIKVRVRNPTAGAIVLNTTVRFTPRG